MHKRELKDSNQGGTPWRNDEGLSFRIGGLLCCSRAVNDFIGAWLQRKLLACLKLVQGGDPFPVRAIYRKDGTEAGRLQLNGDFACGRNGNFLRRSGLQGDPLPYAGERENVQVIRVDDIRDGAIKSLDMENIDGVHVTEYGDRGV